MESLKTYTDNEEVIQLLHNVMKIFKEGSSGWSFLQYFWVKEELMSMMENYQTRIISFIDSGQQNEKGQIIYVPRNAHNIKSLGSTVNHPEIEFTVNTVPPTNLQY